jgi:hypothetical protein
MAHQMRSFYRIKGKDKDSKKDWEDGQLKEKKEESKKRKKN